MVKKIKAVTAGMDAGNNSIKLDLGEGNVVSYENIFCERNETKLENYYKMNPIDKVNKYTLKDYLDVEVSIDNEVHSFIFGEQARENKTDIDERQSSKYKSKDKQLTMNSIVALANTIIANLDKSEWEDKMSVDVGIAVGLPFHEYKIKDTEDDYKKNFLKTFKIKFLNPSYPVRELTLNVKEVDVDIEGLAALRKILFDKGYFDRPTKEIKGRVASIIDIGCYSVDIISGIFKEKIDEDGQAYTSFTTLYDICDGIPKGVGNAMDNVILGVSSEHAREIGQNRKITRQEVSQAAESNNNLQGTKISIEPFYSDECSKFGRKIADSYVQLMLSAGYKDSLEKIYIAGGGALINVIVDNLKDVLNEFGFDLNLIEIAESPVYANAEGYCGIAKVNLSVE